MQGPSMLMEPINIGNQFDSTQVLSRQANVSSSLIHNPSQTQLKMNKTLNKSLAAQSTNIQTINKKRLQTLKNIYQTNFAGKKITQSNSKKFKVSPKNIPVPGLLEANSQWKSQTDLMEKIRIH